MVDGKVFIFASFALLHCQTNQAKKMKILCKFPSNEDFLQARKCFRVEFYLKIRLYARAQCTCQLFIHILCQKCARNFVGKGDVRGERGQVACQRANERQHVALCNPCDVSSVLEHKERFDRAAKGDYRAMICHLFLNKSGNSKHSEKC